MWRKLRFVHPLTFKTVNEFLMETSRCYTLGNIFVTESSGLDYKLEPSISFSSCLCLSKGSSHELNEPLD